MMEDLDSLPTPELHLLARLGEMLIAWNTAESWLQGLILIEMGRSDKMQVLTTHMGNVAMTDALRTLAADFADEELAPHLTHYAEVFDRLREYRNFYAHASLVRWPEKGEARVYLHQATARGKFALTQIFLRTREVETLIERCLALSHYASELSVCIEARKRHLSGQQPSWPEKPPLPDKLRKPRRLLRELKSPPRA